GNQLLRRFTERWCRSSRVCRPRRWRSPRARRAGIVPPRARWGSARRAPAGTRTRSAARLHRRDSPSPRHRCCLRGGAADSAGNATCRKIPTGASLPKGLLTWGLPDFRLTGGAVFYRRAHGEGGRMGSLAGELKRREAAARAEADRLRARIEELSGDLARAEERVLRLAITGAEVARVLEEPPRAGTARREGTAAGETGAGLADRGGDGAAVAGRRRGVGAAAGLSGSAGSGRGCGAAAAGGGVRGRGGAGHGQGEGGGPAVEAEAAGRAGLAGRGARRPVHPAGSRRE